MDLDNLKNIINDAFEDISNIDTNTKGEIRQSVDKTLELLDKGIVRVAEPEGNSKWKVNQWAKKAVLLSYLYKLSGRQGYLLNLMIWL